MEEKRPKKKSKRPEGAPKAMSTSKPGGAISFLKLPEEKMSDPRFVGEVDKIGFVKNYGFLQEHRMQEIKKLSKIDPHKDASIDPEELKKRLQSLKDQHKTFEIKQKDVQERLNWHREERERIAEGKKPFWIGKKEMKNIEQRRKFEELKETGKLQAYLKKRRKKLISKDRKDDIL